MHLILFNRKKMRLFYPTNTFYAFVIFSLQKIKTLKIENTLIFTFRNNQSPLTEYRSKIRWTMYKKLLRLFLFIFLLQSN